MKVEPPKPPDTYPPIKDFENKFRFPPLTETEKAIVLKASALDDAFRYSGYYLTRKRQKPGMERYSDLYKLIAGKRSIYDELSAMPSKIFPKELRKGLFVFFVLFFLSLVHPHAKIQKVERV